MVQRTQEFLWALSPDAQFAMDRDYWESFANSYFARQGRMALNFRTGTYHKTCFIHAFHFVTYFCSLYSENLLSVEVALNGPPVARGPDTIKFDRMTYTMSYVGGHAAVFRGSLTASFESATKLKSFDIIIENTQRTQDISLQSDVILNDFTLHPPHSNRILEMTNTVATAALPGSVALKRAVREILIRRILQDGHHGVTNLSAELTAGLPPCQYPPAYDHASAPAPIDRIAPNADLEYHGDGTIAPYPTGMYRSLPPLATHNAPVRTLYASQIQHMAGRKRPPPIDTSEAVRNDPTSSPSPTKKAKPSAKAPAKARKAPAKKAGARVTPKP
ncbi:hypothetical protein HKX48_005638 [Thoreauomyces humboldtii]|nr:hypothetical protein HKX48_005638 [Thoreauomyces humboldtii]